MNQYYVCSLSGGKDSTAMFLELIRRKYPLDEVVYCDTGLEFPAMERHIEKLRKVAKRHGIKFTTLKSEKSFEYYMNEYMIKKKDGTTQKGWSWPGPRMRWCTSRLKQQVIKRYFKKMRKTHNVYQYIGIAFEERYRLERPGAKEPDRLYPLVEWGMSGKINLQYCYDHGYDWEGLYEIFKRVSCWCCPLQSLTELRKLRKHFPDLWQKLKDMDSRTRRKFRADYSVEELEKRFDFEEQRLADGLSIANRDFFVQLGSVLRNSCDTSNDFSEVSQ
jgi:3'-phosphoadenosine 5'-phosphosulfate sulfotransferase (PAPS reductase)/FAD synthetase